MKKTFTALNAGFIIAMLAGAVWYRTVGGLGVKATVSCTFVLFGAVNLIYAMIAKAKLRYPGVMLTGLTLAMLGDVVLGKNFIVGAGLFALGHVMYFIAFCALEKFRRADLLPSAVIFAGAAALLLFYPKFDFGGALMQGVCMAYALIISCMVGKALSNCLREGSVLRWVLAVGSVLFFFSDLMLVLYYFADAPRIVDTLCLYTYYPAQMLLAHSIFHYANARAMVTAR